MLKYFLFFKNVISIFSKKTKAKTYKVELKK